YGDGLMETKTLPVADASGNIYYHYMDEDFGGQGYGRMDVSKRATANAAGELMFSYTYHEVPNASKTKYVYAYSDTGFSNMVTIYEYNASGTLIRKKDYVAGEEYTYYASGRLESKTLDTPDTGGNVQYHYKDENYNGLGYGRLDAMERASANSAGELTFSIVYTGSGDQARIVYTYSDRWTTLVNEYEYDSSDKLVRKYDHVANEEYTYYDSGRIYTKQTSDGTEYVYYDENFNGTGNGRIREKTLGNGSRYVYTAYWGSTDKVGIMEEYAANGTKVATYEYYYDGSTVSGVRKKEGDRTTEFEGDFVRPVYDDNPQYNYQNWWIYGTVYYYSDVAKAFVQLPGEAAVVKYDENDEKWHLYAMFDASQPWNWGTSENSQYVKNSTSQIGLRDSEGNDITYPNLSSGTPDLMPWDESALPSSQMSAAPQMEAALAAAPEEDTEEGDEASGGSTIKGVDISEVLSMQDAQRSNRSNFTGQSVEMDYFKGTDTLMPVSSFNPMASVVEKNGECMVVENDPMAGFMQKVEFFKRQYTIVLEEKEKINR
ncbi:MAG: hypothetical protein PHQ61_08410, partial [Candidatus Omnitrophica bacterium]|nr:hypothetical protein [Candidatus Omnitrophota bacterium]